MRCRVVGLALLLSLTACGGPRTIVVPLDAGAAHLVVGELLHIDLGPANSSIGDAWYLVGPPDATVLGEGREALDVCDEPGCGGRAGWTFPTHGEGTTWVVFQYCYRSGPQDCRAEPDRGPMDPVRFTVTVG